MSGPSTPAGRPGKQMSNRLMTMKFMQRAAAATPLPPSPVNTPTPKRAQTSHNDASTPTTPLSAVESPAIRAQGDLAAARSALAAEEAQRSAALERLGVESGETKWAFSYFDHGVKGMGRNDGGIRTVAYGDMESEEENDGQGKYEPWSEVQPSGRMRFGGWKNRDEDNDEKSESSESESDNDEDESAQATTGFPIDPEAAERARKKLEAKKKADRKEREKLAKLRHSKDVNLNGKPKDNSQAKSKPSAPSGAQTCFKCGGLGHVSRACLEKASRGRSTGLNGLR